MLIEFEAEILSALLSSVERGSESDDAIKRLKVGICQERFRAEMTTPVCLELAHVLKVDPRTIADSALKTLEHSENFHFTRGGEGHLNGSLKPSRGAKIVRMLAELGGRILPSHPVLSGPSPILESDAARRERENASSPDLGINSSLKRGEQLGDKILSEFVAVRNPRIGGDPFDLLVYLVLLEDAIFRRGEADATKYLQGIAGRDNSAWYLSRFLSIVAQFSESRLLPEGEIPNELSNFTDALLKVRGAHRLGVSMHQPERVVRALFEMIDQFISLYNRPQIRIALSARSQLGLEFESLALLGQRFVVDGLRNILGDSFLLASRAIKL